MDIKTASEKLLKLAETLERQAEEASYMICDKCNHTATLRSINERRAKAAADHHVMKVASVTVNDVVSCPACTGKLSYVETADSRKFYVETADGTPLLTDETNPEGTPPEENQPPLDQPVNPDSDMPPTDDAPPAAEGETPVDIFKPVDEQDAEQKGEELDLSYDDEPTEGEPSMGEIPEGDTPVGEGESESGPKDDNPHEDTEAPKDEDLGVPTDEDTETPKEEEAPEDAEAPKGDEEVPEVVEEEVPSDGDVPPEGDVPPPKGKKEVEFPKKKTPQFKKMKEASVFAAKVAKYLM